MHHRADAVRTARRPGHPTAAETRYEVDLLRRALTVHRATMLALRPHLNDELVDRPKRADAVVDLGLALRILEAVRATFRDTYAPKPGDVAPIGRQVDLFAADQLRRALGVPRVGIPAAADTLKKWTVDNVDLISTIDERYFASVVETVTEGYHRGTNTRDLTAAIRDRYNVAQSDARRIARDQVGKLNGRVTEERQTKLGISEYKWGTSHDERVRPDHRDLDGQIFEWKDPPVVNKRTGERANPGGDIQCRCVAIPILPEWAARAAAK